MPTDTSTTGLNPEQREAVLTTEGPLLVIAGPGSGKTRVIIQRIAHLINDLEIPPAHIMAVTFTNKAATELIERLSSTVPAHAARAAQVSNFHRFCGMINRRHATSIGLNAQYTIYDQDDQLTVVRRAMEAVGISPTNDGIRASSVLSNISHAKSMLLTPHLFAEWAQTNGPDLDLPDEAREAAVLSYPHYQRELELSNAMDFDDIIMRANRILQEADHVRLLLHRRYQYIMVDEYQDTNFAQHQLVRFLTGPRLNLCVVGDPNQSIYGWRNARIKNIVDFTNYYPDAHTIRLGRNYRSTSNIVDSAAELISHNRTRINNPLSSEGPKGPPIRIAAAATTDDEATWTIAHIQELINDKQCQWNDCAVMYRTNAQSRPFEENCINNSIPYRLIGGTRFYQRKEIKDILAYLRVIQNQGDSVSLQRIINLPPRSIGSTTIGKILEFAGSRLLTMMQAVRAAASPKTPERPQLADRPMNALRSFTSIIDDMRAATDSATLTELIDRILQRTGLEDHIKADENGAERWENLLEFRASTARPEFSGAPARDTLAPFLEHTSLFADTDDYDADQNALTLITLHQAKGLEFETVAMPGLVEGMLPHGRTDDIEEERRLCYVGVTRAKTHLFISWPELSLQFHRPQFNTPSRFLAELPKDHYIHESYPKH